MYQTKVGLVCTSVNLQVCLSSLLSFFFSTIRGVNCPRGGSRPARLRTMSLSYRADEAMWTSWREEVILHN